MNPNATGQIRADGVFDVVRGIPTSDTAMVCKHLSLPSVGFQAAGTH